MKLKHSVILFITLFLFSSLPAFSQESEAVVVDEVVAQVNDGVLTLSRVKKEMKEVVDAMVQQGKKPEEAAAEVKVKENEIIANLINEELLLQKGKELGADTEADTYVNQQFLQQMKQFGLKNLEALYGEMRKVGVDPDQYRASLRDQYVRDSVLRREVDGKIYYGLTSKEIKDYYEKNKAKFTKPETVTLSEIFLNFAGRDENAVREKAKQLVMQLRGGADFEKLALENSDRPEVAQNKGKVGKMSVTDLNDKMAAAVKPVKVGGVTDPLEIEGGLEIIRVDDREGASSESVFDENAVRSALTYEKAPQERRKYMAALRRESYIKIADTYKDRITPVLYKDDTTASK